MPFTKLSERLGWPYPILAGPILRRVEKSQVTVWIALSQQQTVRLDVFDRSNNVVLTGKRKTVKLGEMLWVVAVTAEEGSGLATDQVYSYNLFKGDTAESLISLQLLDLTYEAGPALPSFILPSAAIAQAEIAPQAGPPPPPVPPAPNDLVALRIVHASCRKPHGEGRDMLAFLDKLIEDGISVPEKRPQMLLLTGDQIYADDVAEVLLFMIRDAVDALGLPPEQLVGVQPEDLKPGMRSKVAKDMAKLTVDTNVSHNHLLTFGEFCAMYLFAWSPLLWPFTFTSMETGDFREQGTPIPNEVEKRCLDNFATNLRSVRRALANIPTYMIFDDHDVTDDLFLHRQWCTDVLTSPLGRRVIENGLSACALFQAWGNSPEQFRDGEAGAKLLGNLPQLQNREELDLILGLPSINEINAWNMDNLERLGPKSGAQLPPGQLPSKVLKFHFALTGSSYQVLFLNTRTHRAFPAKDNKAPAELISEDGFALQIPTPPQDKPPKALTFVVSPAPVFGVEWIDNVQWWQRRLSGRRKADFERWNLSDTCFGRFLSRTSDLGATVDGQQKKATRAVILSGDVHYGYGAQVQYSDGNADTAIAQFTASSLKNQTSITLTAQKHGYDLDTTFRDREIPDLDPEKTADGCYQIEYSKGTQKPASVLPLNLTNLAERLLGDGFFVPDGTQIVGFNNLGVIAVTVDGDAMIAVQTLHWSAPDGEPITTTYTVPLSPTTVTCP